MSSLPLATLQRPAAEAGRSLPALLEGRQLYVASNRGPVHFRLRGGRLEPAPAAGGLATALSDVATRTPFTWIATASSAGDRLAAGRANPWSANGSPRLRFVVASEEALNWFYRRFSNPILWFLQHGLWDQLRRPDLPDMIERGWALGYRPVNEAFARVVGQEVLAARRPVVMMHDYHLYLVPALLRQRTPGALLQHFTHIPWPAPGFWQPLPPAIRRDLCSGLLGADIVGFQTERSALNFLRCCESFVPSVRVDHGEGVVWHRGRTVRVRAYPISVDVGSLRRAASSPETLGHKRRLIRLCGERTIVRVDRLDPSKNIPLGFKAFGLLLERRPDLVGRVRFLAFLIPSRANIAEYRRHTQEVWREVEAVNERFGRDGWKPIEVFYEDNRPQAFAGLALADVLLVNPIADGMNLVAKEGPIINERDAVLVLSRGAGAHAQLGGEALSIAPLDLEGTAGALERALEMPLAERRRRIIAMRLAIESEDLSWWMGRQLHDLLGM